MIEARDTFTKYLEEKMAAESIIVKTYTTPHQKLAMNAINIVYLNDFAIIGKQVWKATVSIDILVNNEDITIAPERKAIIWQKVVLDAIGIGKKDGWYDATAKQWKSGGYISWEVLNGLTFKNVPNDTYIHKNLTIFVMYFLN